MHNLKAVHLTGQLFSCALHQLLHGGGDGGTGKDGGGNGGNGGSGGFRGGDGGGELNQDGRQSIGQRPTIDIGASCALANSIKVLCGAAAQRSRISRSFKTKSDMFCEWTLRTPSYWHIPLSPMHDASGNHAQARSLPALFNIQSKYSSIRSRPAASLSCAARKSS